MPTQRVQRANRRANSISSQAIDQDSKTSMNQNQLDALRRYYSGKSDDQLKAAAKMAGSLIPESREELISEMQARGLNACDAELSDLETVLETLRAELVVDGQRHILKGRRWVLMCAGIASSALAVWGVAQLPRFGLGIFFVALMYWLVFALLLRDREREIPGETGINYLAADRRRPVLYLRSFLDDFPYESTVLQPLYSIGPVIALGKPGELDPRTGVSRLAFMNKSWQRGVQLLMRSASLVLVRVGQTNGVVWELEQALRIVPPKRLILQFPRAGKLGSRAHEGQRAALRQIEQAIGQNLPADASKSEFVRFGAGREPIMFGSLKQMSEIWVHYQHQELWNRGS